MKLKKVMNEFSSPKNAQFPTFLFITTNACFLQIKFKLFKIKFLNRNFSATTKSPRGKGGKGEEDDGNENDGENQQEIQFDAGNGCPPIFGNLFTQMKVQKWNFSGNYKNYYANGTKRIFKV